MASQQARFVAQAQGRAYASLSDDYYGVGSGGPERGLWGKVLGGTASGDALSGAPFSASLGGVAIGADLLRTDQAYGGLAASWVRTWAAGKGPEAATRLSFDSYQISAYGSAAPRAFGGRLSVDAMVGVAWNRYGQERRIDFLGSAARANYNGEQYLGRLTVGYAFTGDRVTSSVGAYQLEGTGVHLFERIDGDYFTILGLPLLPLLAFLRGHDLLTV